jgi:Ferritin-like
MTNDNKITELMKVKATEHNLDWLTQSLQAAIKLELATLPPYLSALWSIKSPGETAGELIDQIFRDEMFHMGIMCNLLVAIGGTPSLTKPEDVPQYPGPLPGGVRPGLTVPLQGLSPAQLKVFMDIELPEDGPVVVPFATTETFPTIGAFLDAILAAFEKLQPELKGDRQMTASVGGSLLKKLLTLADVREAIQLVKQQGEGRAGQSGTPEDTGEDDLAHYYRFAEIYYGRQLRKHPVTQQWGYTGPQVPFPAVWPMAVVPLGGYKKEDVPDTAVWQLIEQFDQSFTTMLTQLQAAWWEGSPAKLGQAIGTMFSLSDPAISLMQKPLPQPDGGGNYGPCFRLVPLD